MDAVGGKQYGVAVMTSKQKYVLNEIFMYGGRNCSHLSGLVLGTCYHKGWIDIDHEAEFPYGATYSESAWCITEKGRTALHEASQ